MSDRIVSSAHGDIPLPQKLIINGFLLSVVEYTNTGILNRETEELEKVSGTAWISFDCVPSPLMNLTFLDDQDYHRLTQNLEVVPIVKNSQTEVSIADAVLFDPEIHIGDSLKLDLGVTNDEFKNITRYEDGVINWLKENRKMGQALMVFENVTIKPFGLSNPIGVITNGVVTYPDKIPIPNILLLEVAGLLIKIKSINITPREANAKVVIQLPARIVSKKTCRPAELDLGVVEITPDCELYAERNDEEFGPWIIGDQGVWIQGNGYVVDLSLSHSPPSLSPVWQGVLLKQGIATAEGLLPNQSNTAYLTGQYNFVDALINKDGFQGRLDLSKPHKFSAHHPSDYTVDIQSGYLLVTDNAIASGKFDSGSIALPITASAKDGIGDQLTVSIDWLEIGPSLDVTGRVSFNRSNMMWGELTQINDEALFWQMQPEAGYLYLPAGALHSFSPDAGGAFLDFTPDSVTVFTHLITMGMPGVTILLNESPNNTLTIFSPDRKNSAADPILIENIRGWLNIGNTGLNGELIVNYSPVRYTIGNPDRFGYIGGEPFNLLLFTLDKMQTLAQFSDSAIYDSDIAGELKIPYPCDIPQLNFRSMTLSSTAHFIGGDVELPDEGVNLNYWDLKLVPTGNASKAGVISVRTGQIVYLAAGVEERVHFDERFKLSWLEMLADGNLGELFLDFNNNGQKFDKITFTPHHLALSEYDPVITDPYLAVCGTLHLKFFGLIYLNIRDARYISSAAPYYQRYVTIPDYLEPQCKRTDLSLFAKWVNKVNDNLGVFDFPDQLMSYDETHQEGFIGVGTTDISFLHSDPLDAKIEIHSGIINIRVFSTKSHDLDLGLAYNVSGVKNIMACIRIDGPLLERFSLYALLDFSHGLGDGIFGPKSNVGVEVNLNITPNSLDFSASGDMVVSFAGAAVDFFGSVHLFFDYSAKSAEGDMIGRIDCNAYVVGLEAEGQVTWYINPNMFYIQGRMKLVVCSWVASGGLEGGFFLGVNAPKDKVWVLSSGSEKFHMTGNILPDTITGIFGYGQLSISRNFVVFGGGIEIYAAMGAFTKGPDGEKENEWTTLVLAGGSPIPYVLGRCGISVHGNILGGLVGVSAWAVLSLVLPTFYFEGTFGLKGCVLWVICGSIEVTAGLDKDGFYLA